MQVSSLIEFLDAAADTKFVQGPYEERGGIMLVAYPGSFKSTVVNASLAPHPDAIRTSDLNVQQWIKIKDDFVTDRFTIIGFTDFEKIYQRHSSTASHVEGIVKGLVAEGYGVSPSGDTRMPVIPARALVIGAMTNHCMEQKYDDWQKSGFLRRFIWLTFAVKNQNKISEAIEHWEKIDFGKIKVRPANRQIKVNFTKERAAQLRKMMREQPGMNGIGYILLKKVAAVLEWKYSGNGGSKKVTQLLDDLTPAFSRNGGRIVL